MADNIKVGESGRVFYFNAGFDLSNFTRLELRWQKPSGGAMVRDSSSSVVSISATTVFVTALSVTLASNTYAIYTIGAGSATEIDEKGDWKVWLTYEVSTDSPVTRLISDADDSGGNPIVMTVDAGRTSATVVDDQSAGT